MRISDWSSDVCSSDLRAVDIEAQRRAVISRRDLLPRTDRQRRLDIGFGPVVDKEADRIADADQPIAVRPGGARRLEQRALIGSAALVGLQPAIGRASCRARGCQYV